MQNAQNVHLIILHISDKWKNSKCWIFFTKTPDFFCQVYKIISQPEDLANLQNEIWKNLKSK